MGWDNVKCVGAPNRTEQTMPLIHPTLPGATPHMARKSGAAERADAIFVSMAPPDQPGDCTAISRDNMVTPVAPPSAVQLQIKAIITEQVQTLAAAEEDVDDNRT